MLLRVLISAGRELDFAALGREFPMVEPASAQAGSPSVELGRWARGAFPAFEIEDRLAASDSRSLHLDAHGLEEPTAVALAFLTRIQYRLVRRNASSQAADFDALLERHHALHDLSKPLVRADHAHALDVWHWMLRLDPSAGRAVQAAALFHDVERLLSEPDVRVEQHAHDYLAFKEAHARAGARLTAEALAGLLAPDELERVAGLVARHERPGDDPELALLNDADALSFFSLNAPGFYDYYGEPHTRRKVAYTLGRLRPAERRHLGRMRHRPEVARLLEHELRGFGEHALGAAVAHGHEMKGAG